MTLLKCESGLLVEAVAMLCGETDDNAFRKLSERAVEMEYKIVDGLVCTLITSIDCEDIQTLATGLRHATQSVLDIVAARTLAGNNASANQMDEVLGLCLACAKRFDEDLQRLPGKGWSKWQDIEKPYRAAKEKLRLLEVQSLLDGSDPAEALKQHRLYSFVHDLLREFRQLTLGLERIALKNH